MSPAEIGEINTDACPYYPYGFFSMRQLLNNTKLGNLQRLMCAQIVRNAQPVEKIKLGTHSLPLSFWASVIDKKVGNWIREPCKQETLSSCVWSEDGEEKGWVEPSLRPFLERTSYVASTTPLHKFRDGILIHAKIASYVWSGIHFHCLGKKMKGVLLV